MKTFIRCSLALLFAPASPLFAAEATAPVASHARTIWEALGYMLVFAVSGIAMAIFGYRAFDKFTPGDLHKEIVEKQNVAAAIIAGAVVLGICIIIAASMIG